MRSGPEASGTLDNRDLKIAKKILTTAAILGMAFSGSVIEAAAANASTTPVVYAANNNGWDAHMKPGNFYFGNGGAPFFTNLRWTSWNGTSAWATGKMWTETPGCSPSYKCMYYSRWVGVYLNMIRWHNGIRYYARMAVEFRQAGRWHWDTGWLQGGYWVFPLTWPYL